MLSKHILKKILFPLIFIVALSACQSQRAFMVHENALVFTAKYTKQKKLSVYKAESYWTPSTEDIAALEKELPEYLKENAHIFYAEIPPWEKLEKYQRQYIGYKENGQHMIYGNYFCGAGNLDWTVEFIEVMDGGECFFQIRYDLKNGTFTELRVNGEA